MQTQRYPEWLQTCQHLQLISATRCLFLKSHPRTAAPHTHARAEEEAPWKAKRGEEGGGVPAKTARRCQRRWGRKEGERGAWWAPARIWSERWLWPIQMRRGAPGEISARCPNSDEINYTRRTNASRLTHLCVPVCWWRSCRLLADGGRRLSVQVERRGFYRTELQPPARSHRSATETGGASDETIFLPLFLSMTRQRRNNSPSPPSLSLLRCLYAHSGKSAITSVCVLVIGWRVLRYPREASRPKICSTFKFKIISAFTFKKYFWNTNTCFSEKSNWIG